MYVEEVLVFCVLCLFFFVVYIVMIFVFRLVIGFFNFFVYFGIEKMFFCFLGRVFFI